MTNAIQKLRDYTGLFGWRGIPLAVRSRFVNQPVLVEEKTPFSEHTLRFRLKTSDVPIAAQIFLNQEYAFEPKRNIRTVLDVGANTGFSSLYFAEQFPDAQIVALEPELENFELLRANTAGCVRIRPEQMALWNCDMELDVVDWFGKCGFRTTRPEDCMPRDRCGTVPGISLPSLMDRYGWERIDFLKMDIEGAEKTVLEGPPDWLSRVGILAVELHDWLDPDCSRVFDEVKKQFDVHWKNGENEFCARKGWVE